MTYFPLTMTRFNDEDKEELKGKKKDQIYKNSRVVV